MLPCISPPVEGKILEGKGFFRTTAPPESEYVWQCLLNEPKSAVTTLYHRDGPHNTGIPERQLLIFSTNTYPILNIYNVEFTQRAET